jgi:hypothetical protein
MEMFLKILSLLLIILLLAGCDIPKFFWEQEGRKVVDDVVDEEGKLNPPAVKKIPAVHYEKK